LFLIQPDSPVDDGIVKNMRFMPGSIEALVLLLGLSQCADNDFGEGGQEANRPPDLLLLIAFRFGFAGSFLGKRSVGRD
jgi:hypothetical protein